MPFFFLSFNHPANQHRRLFSQGHHHINKAHDSCHVIKSQTHSNGRKVDQWNCRSISPSCMFLWSSSVLVYLSSLSRLFCWRISSENLMCYGENHFSSESDRLDNLKPNGAGKTNRQWYESYIFPLGKIGSKVSKYCMVVFPASEVMKRCLKKPWKTGCCWQSLCFTVSRTVIHNGTLHVNLSGSW